MLNDILDNIKLERAKTARELEYLTEMAINDEIDDLTEKAESDIMGYIETSDELLEAKADLDKLSDNEDESSKEEIQRIMEATEDLTFDQMIGVESYLEKI